MIAEMVGGATIDLVLFILRMLAVFVLGAVFGIAALSLKVRGELSKPPQRKNRRLTAPVPRDRGKRRRIDLDRPKNRRVTS